MKRFHPAIRMFLSCVLALLLTVQLAMPVMAASVPEQNQTGSENTAEASVPGSSGETTGEKNEDSSAEETEESESQDPNASENPNDDENLPQNDDESAIEEEAAPMASESEVMPLGVSVSVNISTFEELMQFAADWNADGYEGSLVTVTLTADIYGPDDMYAGGWTWTPIGTSGNPFDGIFDGAGHLIHGLTVCNASDKAYTSANNAFGIFGYVQGDFNGAGATCGIIKNLSVSNFMGSYADAFYKGALVGHMDRGFVQNVGILEKLTGSYGYDWSELENGVNMGMIAGYAKNSLIEKSFSYGDLMYDMYTEDDSFMAVGGLVGCAESTDAALPMIIRDSYAVGPVRGSHGAATQSGAVGGIAGKLDASAGAPESGVFRCYTGNKQTAIYRSSGHEVLGLTYGGTRGSVGGIAGEISGGQLKNNISMIDGVYLRSVKNLYLSADDAANINVHRIAGKNTGGDISGNYAFDGFVVRHRQQSDYTYPDVPFTKDTALDGADVSGRLLRSPGVDGNSDIWRQTLGAEAWHFATGKAPVLKGMGAGVCQTGELPLYLVSPADVDRFSQSQVNINNASDLAELSAYVNSGAGSSDYYTQNRLMQGRTVTLTADVDISVYPDWVPIGGRISGVNNIFKGAFDGGGHTISKLSTGVSSGSAGHFLNTNIRLRGLFGNVDAGWNDGANGSENIAPAGVKNLVLKNPQVCIPAGNEAVYDASSYYSNSQVLAGAIAAYADDWNNTQTVIENCAVVSTLGADGNTTGARVWAEGYAHAIGGLVGDTEGRGNSFAREENFVIENSYFVGEADGGAHALNAGGITGVLQKGTYIDNCFVAPDGAGREIKGPAMVGGIAGSTYGNDPSSGTGSQSQEYACIKNSYVLSDVRGGSKVGGIIGGIGLVGQFVMANIMLGDVYGMGTDPAVAQVGGIVGGWAYGKQNVSSGAGIQNNINMSENITSAAGFGTAGRSTGSDFGYDNGRTFIGTLVDGYTVLNRSDMNGSGQTDAWIKNSGNLSSSFDYNSNYGKNTAADHWIFADGKLPVLKNMPAGYTQKTAMPSYIKAIPMATGFSIDKPHYDFTLEKQLNSKIFYVWYKPSPATSLLPDMEVKSNNDAISFYGNECDFPGFEPGQSNTATISVTGKFGNPVTKTFTVKIDEQIPEVTSISMSNFTVQANRSYKLAPYKQPSRSRLEGAVWTSSDEAVATVDQNGLVTGVSEGSADITVTMPAEINGGTEVSRKVTATVKPAAPITSFEFIDAPSQMDLYGYTSFKLNILPDEVLLSNSDVTFAASPENLVRLSPYYDSYNKQWNINVSGQGKAGSVTITASVNDNGTVWSDSVTIRMGTPKPLTGLSIPASYTLKRGASERLDVSAKPDEAALPDGVYLQVVSGTAKTPDGKTTNREIVSVNGANIFGNEAGSVQVVAKGGGFTSGRCTITVPATLDEIAIDPFNLSLKIGGSARQLNIVPVTPYAKLPQDISVDWNVENELDENGSPTAGVVEITDGGLVSPLKLGSATVNVSVTGADIEQELTAIAQVNVRVGITGIWFSDSGSDEPVSSLVLTAPGSYDLAADGLRTNPAGLDLSADGISVKFAKLSNKAYTLNEAGLLAAKAPGTFTVSATITDKTNPAAPEVFTASVPVKLVSGLKSLAPDGSAARTLAVKKSLTLKLKYSPSNVSVQSVEWSSDKPGIVKVDQSGKAVAVAPGKATVKATVTPLKLSPDATGVMENGAIIQSFTITVPATAVDIRQTRFGDVTLAEPASVNSKTLRLVPAAYMDTVESDGADTSLWKNHDTLTLRADALTTDTENAESVTWTSSDKYKRIVSIAPAADGSCVVTAAGKGTATLTAKAKNGKTAKVKVSVFIPVRSIRLAFTDASKNKTSDILLGKTRTLAAKLNIGLAKPTNTKVVWKIENGTGIITLKNGAVKGVKPGKATVSATSAEDGRCVAAYEVVVTAPATSVRLNQKSFTMAADDTSRLSATINNGGAHTGTRPDNGAPYTAYKWQVSGGLTFIDSRSGISTAASPELSTAGITKKTTATVKLTVTSGTVTGTRKALNAVKLTVTVQPEGVNFTKVSKLNVVVNKYLPGTGQKGRKVFYAGETVTPSLVFNKGVVNKNVTWSAECSDGGEPARYIRLNEATGAITALGGTSGETITITAVSDENPAYSDAFTFNIRQRAAYVVLVRDNGEGSEPDPDLDAKLSGAITLRVGETLRISANIAPESAKFDNSNVKWSGSGSVARLTDAVSGAVPSSAGTNSPVIITALKAGSVTVTATAVDGSKKKASLKIRVVQQVNDIVISSHRQAEGLDTAALTLNRGGSVTLKAKLNAANQKNEAAKKVVNQPAPSSGSVRWVILEQRDESGVPVESGIITLSKGKVTALAKGSALVRVVPAAYGDDYARSGIEIWSYAKKKFSGALYANTIKITVNVPATKVALMQSKFAMAPGAEIRLNAVTTPGAELLSAREQPLVWDVNKQNIIGVTQSGGQTGMGFGPGESGWHGHDITITAENPGVVILKARTNSGKLVSIEISVKANAAAIKNFGLAKNATWLQRGKYETLKLTVNAGIDSRKRAIAPANKNLLWSIEEYYNDGTRVPEGKKGTVATVTTAGKVTAKGDGYAVVRVAAVEDPEKWNDSCTVYCLPKA